MIQDGFLTHPSANPAFWHWEPSNPLLQAVLVAVLTTILSYQFTALIFDICLSLKPRGNAPLRDIHVLLIAEESSPLAASAALFHSPTLSRWRFHGFRGHCPHQLLLLLLIAPLANLVAIVLSLERGDTVTFNDASVAGLALGMKVPGRSVKKKQRMPGCYGFSQRLAALETPSARFMYCGLVISAFGGRWTPSLSVTRNTGGEIKFAANYTKTAVEVQTRINLQTGAEVFVLPAEITREDAKVILATGLKVLGEYCEFEGDLPESQVQVDENDEGNWRVIQSFECAVELSEKELAYTAILMSQHATLVESDRMLVMTGSDFDAGVVRYVDGGNLPFFTRHASYVSFTVLAILTVGVTLTRIVTKIVTNNDVHLGIETILKEGMGLLCCDSMLQSRTSVSYREKLEVRRDGFERKRYKMLGVGKEDCSM